MMVMFESSCKMTRKSSTSLTKVRSSSGALRNAKPIRLKVLLTSAAVMMTAINSAPLIANEYISSKQNGGILSVGQSSMLKNESREGCLSRVLYAPITKAP